MGDELASDGVQDMLPSEKNYSNSAYRIFLAEGIWENSRSGKDILTLSLLKEDIQPSCEMCPTPRLPGGKECLYF